MAKIYTKKGDSGKTQLFSGETVKKSDIRLEVYGTIDELTSFLSIASAFSKSEEIISKIKKIQKKLFHLSTDFATLKRKKEFVSEKDIKYLEDEMDLMSEKLPPQKSFIIPGGSKTSSFLQVARTICRRAERKASILLEDDSSLSIQMKFLNRLSDYLFLLARYNNYLEGIREEKIDFEEK